MASLSWDFCGFRRDAALHRRRRHPGVRAGDTNGAWLVRGCKKMVRLSRLYAAPIQRFWMERVVPWMMSNDLGGRSRYGISHDDPGIAAPKSLRYDAAVTANISGPPLRGGGFHSSLPGGRYAVMPFRGTNSEIVPAWADLLGAERFCHLPRLHGRLQDI